MLTPMDRLIWGVGVPFLIVGLVYLHSRLTYKNSTVKWFLDIVEEYYAPTLIKEL